MGLDQNLCESTVNVISHFSAKCVNLNEKLANFCLIPPEIAKLTEIGPEQACRISQFKTEVKYDSVKC